MERCVRSGSRRTPVKTGRREELRERQRRRPWSWTRPAHPRRHRPVDSPTVVSRSQHGEGAQLGEGVDLAGAVPRKHEVTGAHLDARREELTEVRRRCASRASTASAPLTRALARPRSRDGDDDDRCNRDRAWCCPRARRKPVHDRAWSRRQGGATILHALRDAAGTAGTSWHREHVERGQARLRGSPRPVPQRGAAFPNACRGGRHAAAPWSEPRSGRLPPHLCQEHDPPMRQVGHPLRPALRLRLPTLPRSLRSARRQERRDGRRRARHL